MEIAWYIYVLAISHAFQLVKDDPVEVADVGSLITKNI